MQVIVTKISCNETLLKVWFMQNSVILRVWVRQIFIVVSYCIKLKPIRRNYIHVNNQTY
jgi:hypothetical protein